jgi:PAS domain S-box-containing protein
MASREKTVKEPINDPPDLRQKCREQEILIGRLTNEIESLQISRARQEAIIEAFDGLIYVCSADLEIEFMNDRFIERTGRNPIGEKCYPALHERDEICPWCVNDRVQAGETVAWEVLSPKDNRCYHIINTPVRNPDGSISKMAMIRDVTENKLAEKALRENEQRYRTLFEESRDAIAIVTTNGSFVDANDSFSDLFGYRRDEIMTGNASQLWAIPSDRIRFQRELEQNGSVREYEWKARRKDGTLRHCLLTATATRDENFNVLEYQGIIRDITDLKQAEEALRQRTEELERSNKDLEQFAYIAAHDLREPLLAIAAYLKLLERRYKAKLDTDGERYLSGAINSTLRMDSLIQSLLAYSRLGSEDQSFEKSDCNKIISTALANLSSIIEETRATVTVGHLPTVLVNPSQMVQLFQNLISNAIKFAGEYPPEIHIGVTRCNTEWQYFVKDNGIGIEPPYFDRIFLLFQRIKNRANYPGTGIGLANCRRIVEHHGGRIWVESTPGKGSTFFFTIPDRREGAE